jgi:DNA-binding transcriptional ArsR family regulator
MHAFDVLADPVRRRILETLRQGDHASGEIVDVVGREFGIGQSAVSQHLRVLRENGFANVTVSGARRIYAIDATPLSDVDQWLSQFRRYWGPKLEALATEVARGRQKRD